MADLCQLWLLTNYCANYLLMLAMKINNFPKKIAIDFQL